jgi:hypothetical protein
MMEVKNTILYCVDSYTSGKQYQTLTGKQTPRGLVKIIDSDSSHLGWH